MESAGQLSARSTRHQNRAAHITGTRVWFAPAGVNQQLELRRAIGNTIPVAHRCAKKSHDTRAATDSNAEAMERPMGNFAEPMLTTSSQVPEANKAGGKPGNTSDWACHPTAMRMVSAPYKPVRCLSHFPSRCNESEGCVSCLSLLVLLRYRSDKSFKMHWHLSAAGGVSSAHFQGACKRHARMAEHHTSL